MSPKIAQPVSSVVLTVVAGPDSDIPTPESPPPAELSTETTIAPLLGLSEPLTGEKTLRITVGLRPPMPGQVTFEVIRT